MVVIHLYGVLEAVAQRVTKLSTESFDDSMRGLLANFPKLRAVLSKTKVTVLIDGQPMDFEDCLRPMAAERIDIVPAIGGAGPAVFILVGSALYAGAATIAGLFVGTALAGVVTTAAIAQFGISMIIGGISQLLTKSPKSNIGQRGDDAASYNFNGAVNVTQQGNIVPVGYGKMKIGSVVISANIQTWDIPIGAVPADLPPEPPANPDGPFYVEHGSE